MDGVALDYLDTNGAIMEPRRLLRRRGDVAALFHRLTCWAGRRVGAAVASPTTACVPADACAAQLADARARAESGPSCAAWACAAGRTARFARPCPVRGQSVPARAVCGSWCPRVACAVGRNARRARRGCARWGGTLVVPVGATVIATACPPVPCAARGARASRARWGRAPVLPARGVPARPAAWHGWPAPGQPRRPTTACTRRRCASLTWARLFMVSVCHRSSWFPRRRA